LATTSCSVWSLSRALKKSTNPFLPGSSIRERGFVCRPPNFWDGFSCDPVPCPLGLPPVLLLELVAGDCSSPAYSDCSDRGRKSYRLPVLARHRCLYLSSAVPLASSVLRMGLSCHRNPRSFNEV
jgi:hypothetical protein